MTICKSYPFRLALLTHYSAYSVEGRPTKKQHAKIINKHSHSQSTIFRATESSVGRVSMSPGPGYPRPSDGHMIS